MKRVVLAVLPLLVGCAGAPPVPVEQMVQEWAAFMNRDHLLVPGDVLTISAFQQPELTQEVTVSAEGSVSLTRLANPVRAAGRPVAEFRAAVESSYAELLPSVEVSVNLKKPNVKSVFVAGEVNRPGAVPWSSQLTITMAVAAAGGFQITAKDSDVLLVRPVADGSPRTVRVNVWGVLKSREPDVPLLPGDVVWAQTSGIADVGNWVELWIRRLLPFQVAGPAIPIGNQ
ncbi:MAG: polysaccharide biosynthesis/export family protein [Planctomycetota bacterium]